MKIARCNHDVVVNVILINENNKEHLVTMFNDIIKQILMFISTEATHSGLEDIADNLLSAPVLCYTINHKDIVCAVST